MTSFPLRPSRAAMSRRTRTALSFALAGTILAVVATAVLLAVFPRSDALLPIGAQTPDFTLRTATGATVNLQSLRGKAVLLEFCATWSSPCAVEAPALNRLAARLSGPAVAFVSVNGDSEDATSVDAFRRNFHVRIPLALDPGPTTVSFPAHGSRGPVTGRYRVTRFPTFYVLDPRGRITWRSAGEQPDALLVRELRRAAGHPLP